MWTIGYICAFFFGNYLIDLGGDAWRWLLACSALPAVVLLMGFGTPESPRWLISKGRVDEARAVVEKHIGPRIAFSGRRPAARLPSLTTGGCFAQ